MTAKIHQLVAIETSMKSRVYAELTDRHKTLQKDDLFNGHARKYRPKDDDPTQPLGEQLPEEHKRVMFKVSEILQETARKLTEHYDLQATLNRANCEATADVVVDGKVLFEKVPVTTLLFLEKRLNDIHTLAKKLPVLNPAEDWTWNAAANAYATRPVETVRTKKVVRPMVFYEATPQHPAQVKEVTEDLAAGTWSTTKSSGALPASQVAEIVRRVETLQNAVKFARELANERAAPSVKLGGALFDYLFGPVLGPTAGPV